MAAEAVEAAVAAAVEWAEAAEAEAVVVAVAVVVLQWVQVACVSARNAILKRPTSEEPFAVISNVLSAALP